MNASRLGQRTADLIKAHKNCSKFMPLYLKKPPRAKGKAAITHSQPASATILRSPKYAATAARIAASANRHWRRVRPKKTLS